MVLILSGAVSALAAESSAETAQGGACEMESLYLEQYEPTAGSGQFAGREDCFVTVDAVEGRELTIVDTRGEEDFRRVNIRGAINLPAAQLLHMSELRDRSILLVDQGFRRSNQAEMCQQARLAGFTRLSILKGGMAAWSSSGRDLNGHLQALSELHRIRADAFLVEAMRNRVTLLAEPAVLARLKKLLPEATDLRQLGQSPALEKQIGLVLSQPQGSVSRSLVVFSDHPEALAKVSHFQDAYLFSDSLDELEDYYEEQKVIAKKREQIPDRFRCGRKQ